MKLDPYHNPLIKINLKWIKDLNIRPETIKFLEENMGKKLLNIGLSNIIFWICTKSTSNKNKNKWHYVKLKSFCIRNKMKRKPMEWEKIFATRLSNKGLISKLYEENIQLNSKKNNNPIQKYVENLNRHVSKDDIQMANKYMKRN